jgi:hypothetical protein
VVIGLAVRGDGPVDEFHRAIEPVRTDRQAEHNYSVWFSSDSKTFHRLQWGGCTVVRTRDPERFGRALAFHLSEHGAPRAGLVRTDGLVALYDGRAFVLPSTLRQQMPAYESPLRAAGVILHDAPWVDFDPGTGEVVLEPASFAASHFDEVAQLLPRPRRSDPVTPFGRYQAAAWYFIAIPGAEGPMSRSEAVAAVLSGLRSPLTDEGEAAAMATLFERVPFGRLALETPKELVERIRK